MEEYFWNKDLWSDALKYSSVTELKKKFIITTKFKDIYIDQTRNPKDKPMKLFNIINIDTGAGHTGKLTIMDIDERYSGNPIRGGNFMLRILQMNNLAL